MSYRSKLLEQIEASYSLEELERLARGNVFRAPKPAMSAPAPQPVAETTRLADYKHGFSDALNTVKDVVELQIKRLS